MCFQQQLLIFPHSHGRGNMKGEAKYRALYEDIVASKQIWMAFFDERANYVHAEHTCGMLVRTLALNLIQLADAPSQFLCCFS